MTSTQDHFAVSTRVSISAEFCHDHSLSLLKLPNVYQSTHCLILNRLIHISILVLTSDNVRRFDEFTAAM